MASEWPLKEEERVVFGHPVGYWLALQARADELGVAELIGEIAELRGRQAFCESRLNQIAAALSSSKFRDLKRNEGIRSFDEA
jgi:hypothetical protein